MCHTLFDEAEFDKITAHAHIQVFIRLWGSRKLHLATC